MMPRSRTLPDLRTVAGRLKAARLAAGLTWKQMAYRVGYGMESMRSWEAGRRGMPYEALVLFASGCATSPKWVLTGEGHTPPHLDRIPHIDANGVEFRPRATFPRDRGVALT